MARAAVFNTVQVRHSCRGTRGTPHKYHATCATAAALAFRCCCACTCCACCNGIVYPQQCNMCHTVCQSYGHRGRRTQRPGHNCTHALTLPEYSSTVQDHTVHYALATRRASARARTTRGGRAEHGQRAHSSTAGTRPPSRRSPHDETDHTLVTQFITDTTDTTHHSAHARNHHSITVGTRSPSRHFFHDESGVWSGPHVDHTLIHYQHCTPCRRAHSITVGTRWCSSS